MNACKHNHATSRFFRLLDKIKGNGTPGGMPKKPRDIISEHERAVRDFTAQGDPAVWACFFWPALNRWQAIAAWEPHRQLVPAARALVVQGRQAYGDPINERTIAGDAANAVAYMVLRQMDDPKMAALLMLVSEIVGDRYLFCTSKPDTTRKDATGRAVSGDVVTIEAIPATDLQSAKEWVDSHPDIIRAKTALIGDLLKGPQH